jgi:hypothetical protein
MNPDRQRQIAYSLRALGQWSKDILDVTES